MANVISMSCGDRVRQAAATIRSYRQSREKTVPADLLGEPSWDILLELMACRSDQGGMSVSELAKVINCSTDLAKRWTKIFEERGLIASRSLNDKRYGITPAYYKQMAKLVLSGMG